MNATKSQPGMKWDTVLAGVEHLKPLAGLLDAYRVSCGLPTNLPAAEHFLFERLINHESFIYLAWHEETRTAAGFVQLYPGFSSLLLQPVWTMSNVYVQPEFRRQGVARHVVQAALAMVRERGDWGVELGVQPDQQAAQAFCQALGFEPDERFLRYIKPLSH